MGIFGATHRWVKICHTYPTKMKFATVIPYLKRTRKIYESRGKPLEFCRQQHFLSEITITDCILVHNFQFLCGHVTKVW